MKDIWIFAELNGGVVASSYYELLTKAKELYADTNHMPNFSAVVFGNDNNSAVNALRESGVDTVISAEHKKLGEYHPDYYANTLSELAKTNKPETILISASAIGSELAPTVAAKLQTGLAAHCADICLGDDGALIAVIPAFGGKLLGEIMVPTVRPIMASVKPGVFEKHELSPTTEVRVIDTDTTFLDTMTSGIEYKGKEAIETEGTPIEEAEIVICAGFGIGTRENWKKVTALAKALKASVGYTRPMVDLGYVDNEDSMIGTSGKMIHPKLYIGIGVSGSSHHICGMKDSKLVIAVNTNENADIFNTSNYKVIGDSGTILDELLKAINT